MLSDLLQDSDNVYWPILCQWFCDDFYGIYWNYYIEGDILEENYNREFLWVVKIEGQGFGGDFYWGMLFAAMGDFRSFCQNILA